MPQSQLHYQCNLLQDKLGEIESYLKKLAFVSCVHENFMTGCGNFILGNVGLGSQ
jgi:hypothetical protein